MARLCSHWVLSEQKKNDPMRTLRAWPQLGAAVSIALAEQPHRVLLTEDRKMHTALVYYVHPHPFDAVLFNPNGL